MRLLIVEDHKELVELLAEYVSLRGSQVDAVRMAHNGQEGVELARDFQPDVVLMDLRLSGLNGVEATRRIKAAAPGSRVLIFTGCDDAASWSEAVRAGADGVFLKGTGGLDRLFKALETVQKGNFFLPESADGSVPACG